MKNKVYIFDDIFQETIEKFPHITIRKIDILWHGWKWYCIRRGRNAQFFYEARKRGWLSPRDADSLREYIGLR